MNGGEERSRMGEQRMKRRQGWEENEECQNSSLTLHYLKNGGTEQCGYNLQMVENGVGKVSESQNIQGFEFIVTTGAFIKR